MVLVGFNTENIDSGIAADIIIRIGQEKDRTHNVKHRLTAPGFCALATTEKLIINTRKIIFRINQ